MASEPWKVERAKARAMVWAVLIMAVGAIALAPAARADHWHLMLNGVNTDSGTACPTGFNAMDGIDDAVFGTFHWTASGLTFEYSYENGGSPVAFSPAIEWSSATNSYFFDVVLNWGGTPSSAFVIISSGSGSPADFSCTL